MKLLNILGLVAALCVAGCSTVVERETPIAVRLGETNIETAAIVEALLEEKGTVVQAINGHWRDRNFQAQCVLKGDGDTLTIVFLAPQLRLLTIRLSKPHSIRCERAPRIPSAFEPEYVLVDLACVRLDAVTLQRVLGNGMSVKEEGSKRFVTVRSGEGFAEIERMADGTTRYKNLVHGYEYTLKQL